MNSMRGTLKKYDKYESSYGRGVARIVRVVRFFNDLRVMVNGIKASSRALLWAVAPRHIKIVVWFYLFIIL